jgi:hypothetical protein
MSTTSTSASALRASELLAVIVAASSAGLRELPTISANLSPTCRPSALAVVSTSSARPSPCNNTVAAAFDWCSREIHVRNGASASGSTPSRSSARPGKSASASVRSITGAAGGVRGSSTSFAYNSSGTPPGPPRTTCVASPPSARLEMRKAVLALTLEVSMPTTTATPSATPSTASSNCAGWRRRWRKLARARIDVTARLRRCAARRRAIRARDRRAPPSVRCA